MPSIQEIRAETAKEFWEYLSPENRLFNEPCQLIYRGQRDANWGLEPSLFREPHKPKGIANRSTVTSDFHMFQELRMLQQFVEYCDAIGIALPGDSSQFRKEHLDHTSSALDRYIKKPYDWPNPALYELLALAQHYGLPTRLLDWSTRSFIAAYFAASSALIHAFKPENKHKRLVVWILNIEMKNLYREDLDIVRVPSGYNRNISSQAGCFSILRQKALRQEPFEGTHLLNEYFEDEPEPPLCKVTAPISEANKILELCKLYGVTAATIYPDLYGAAKAVVDDTHRWRWYEHQRG